MASHDWFPGGLKASTKPQLVQHAKRVGIAASLMSVLPGGRSFSRPEQGSTNRHSSPPQTVQRTAFSTITDRNAGSSEAKSRSMLVLRRGVCLRHPAASTAAFTHNPDALAQALAAERTEPGQHSDTTPALVSGD